MTVVIGEALIDLVESDDDAPRLARPGGSPYNVALGLARLGQEVSFAGRISRDPLGSVLRNHASRSGVRLDLTVDAVEPTTVALVELDATGTAQYRFGIDGTADFAWTAAELGRIPDTTAAVHFGSLASWLPPGAAAIHRRIAELRDSGAAVTYDPNVRPHLQPDAAAARTQIEAGVELAHLVKVSEDDLAWLYPQTRPVAIAEDWLTLGPSVVVVTHGGRGCTAVTAAGAIDRPAPPVRVVDTVGAGDAFMSGLLDALLRQRVLTPDGLAHADADLAAALDHAALVAAITCSRAGANPPRRADVTEWTAPR